MGGGTVVVLGNILGAVGSILFAISVYSKTKEGMVKIQTWKKIVDIVSCLVLKGFTGAISSVVTLTRNIFVLKKWDSKWHTIFLISITFIVNIPFVDSFYSVLPCVASVGYTLGMLIAKQPKHLKWSMLITQIMWFVYHLHILNYVTAITTIMLAINTVVSLVIPEKSLKNRSAESSQAT